MYTAVHGGYEPGTRPYMILTRPCTRRVPCTRASLRPVYTAVYGRERTGYTALYGPCTLYTGVFTFTAHEHGTFYGPCTWPCTDLVHGHGRAVYAAVNGTRTRTRPCRQALNTAVFTVRARLCTWAVKTPVDRVHSRTRPCSSHGRTMYMAHPWSCTVCIRPVYTAVYGP